MCIYKLICPVHVTKNHYKLMCLRRKWYVSVWIFMGLQQHSELTSLGAREMVQLRKSLLNL